MFQAEIQETSSDEEKQSKSGPRVRPKPTAETMQARKELDQSKKEDTRVIIPNLEPEVRKPRSRLRDLSALYAADQEEFSAQSSPRSSVRSREPVVQKEELVQEDKPRVRRRESNNAEAKTDTEQASYIEFTARSSSKDNDKSVKEANAKSNNTTSDTPRRRSREAKNSTDKDNSKATVLKFLREMHDFEVFEGDSARFDCQFQANPEPEITWLKNGEEIQERRRKYALDYDDCGRCSLIVKNCTDADDAIYECRLTNARGTISCSAELYVETAGSE